MNTKPIDPFGPEAHNAQAPEHSGNFGHYCPEWDDLWICKDCAEYECCTCFACEPKTPEE